MCSFIFDDIMSKKLICLYVGVCMCHDKCMARGELVGLFLYVLHVDLRNELRLLVFAVCTFTREPSPHTLYAFCINFTENFNGTKPISMTSD